MIENGFFKKSDRQETMIMGLPINPGWWSRRFEYPWALEYAEPDQVVADMGCGYTPRPFKDALAQVCKKVYAVDGDERVLSQQSDNGLVFVVADFTQPIQDIPDGSLDRVFCVSVLEDVGDKVSLALTEFERLLKPGGLCVLTFDVHYNEKKPLGQYPGVELYNFAESVFESGLGWDDKIDFDKRNVVNNKEFNLCVFHCILRKP